MTELLQQLINFIKEASPVVWDTFIKQVYVEAGQALIWTVVLVISTVLLIKCGNYCRHKYNDVDEEDYLFGQYLFGQWMSYAFAIFASLYSVTLITSAVSQFINPEYYAIQMIVGMLE